MNQSASHLKPNGGLSQEQELLQLTDAFAEFTSVNAFLCSSFTAVMSCNEPMKEEVIQGAKYFSEFLQVRARELKYDMEIFRERYISKQSGIKLRR